MSVGGSVAGSVLGRVALSAALLLGAAMAGDARADEGQWMPEQIAELDAVALKRLGLHLRPDEVYNDQDGGVMAAVVNLSGCSASFISPDGLIATNHHCAHSAIQRQSTVDHDYLTDGFLARTRSEELEAKGSTVRMLVSITDVTAGVRKAGAGADDPAARAKAVERAQRELVATCEAKHEGLRCNVAEFYGGTRYKLFETQELEDVRLVYAPPSSVGNFGGEVDNWMWPRHTGDFALLRAYVGADRQPAPHAEDNVPFKPKRWLAVSPDGVGPGDFVAVLGFPGHTDRYLPAADVRRHLEQFLPERVDLYGEWIEILERLGEQDPAIKIKVAARLRGLANRHKNALGKIAGIRRNGIVVRREREEQALEQWAAQQPDPRYRDVLPRIGELTKARRQRARSDFLLSNITSAGSALALAITLVRRAKEQQKPDVERESAYMDRGRKRLWSRTERRLRNFDRRVDEPLVETLVRRIQALPADERFTTVTPAQAVRALRRTRVADLKVVTAMFDDADWAAVQRSRDPMIVWARELVEAIEAQEARDRERTGVMLELEPLYFEMVRAERHGPVYPDANGTLRFSYATVKGYAPRDGMEATPQTTLRGQVAKYSGEAPFDLPDAVRQLHKEAAASYWADPGLGDVPVCFLSTADTTGGNSGSPVIDGRGRLVGLNFDRVWENVAGDYGYHPARSRNITVDARYLLWLLDRVVDAGPLLEEIGVAAKRNAAARPRIGAAAAGDPSPVGVPIHDAVPRTRDASAAGCGCRGPAGEGALLLPVLFLARRRRR